MADRRETPLMLAAADGNTEAVGLLLVAAQARTELQDAAGRTALACATLGGHTGAMQMLLDAKASVDRADYQGRAPLMLAVEARQLAAAELLLLRGARLEGLPPPFLQQLAVEMWQAKQDGEAQLAIKAGLLRQQEEQHQHELAAAQQAAGAARREHAAAQREAEAARRECKVLQRGG